jgi:hypothetical protein
VVHGPAGARSPAPDDERVEALDDLDRGRAVRGSARPPQPARLEADRRVASAVPERRQRPDEVVGLGALEPELCVDGGRGQARGPAGSRSSLNVTS